MAAASALLDARGAALPAASRAALPYGGAESLHLPGQPGLDPLADLTLDAAGKLLLVGLLAFTLIVNNALQKRAVPVPEAISTIAIGVAVGAVATLFPGVNRSTFEKLEDDAARQFLLVFTAPIVFAEGYGMKSQQFFQNITRILCHAFLGTLISTFVVGTAVFYLPVWTAGWAGFQSMSGEAFSLAECLAFGAMISSTDPVTTLAIFKDQDMVENGLSYLYYSILGESILNDAVAITLFGSFSEIVREDGRIDAGISLRIFRSFCQSFSCSTLVGVLGGALTALVLKSARLGAGGSAREHFYFNVPEIGVVVVMAYLPFLVAEALGLSGIVAIMFAGITMRRYAHYNLTEVTRQVFLPTIELLASLCQTYVFVVLGLGVFLLRSMYSAPLILWTGAACLVGRAAHVYPFSWAVNRCSSGPRLSLKEQHVVWFAGLRGAVAFICAMGFPETATTKHRDLFLCTTVVIVGTTLMLLGWPNAAVLRCLDIGMRDGSQLPVREDGNARLGVDLPGQRRAHCISWPPLLNSGPAKRAAERLTRLLMTDDAVAQLTLDIVADSASSQRDALSAGGAPTGLAAMGGRLPWGSFDRTRASVSAAAGQPMLPPALAGVRMSAPAQATFTLAPHEAAGSTRLSAPARLAGAREHRRSMRMLCDP